jgi:hypothetical protein
MKYSVKIWMGAESVDLMCAGVENKDVSGTIADYDSVYTSVVSFSISNYCNVIIC